ncbi:MAG: hypothetical protein JWO77_3758 [Ilumatobacteraceae bacterium]|nr:hypothetical protein [Ilumatobacteraceae bacterium]
MTATFPDLPGVDAIAVDVIGARPGWDPGTDAEAVEIAVEAPGEDPHVLSLSISAAYELREALDDALGAPFWWEEATDDEDVTDAVACKTPSAMRAPEVIDLARERSVRWDEAWTPSQR